MHTLPEEILIAFFNFPTLTNNAVIHNAAFKRRACARGSRIVWLTVRRITDLIWEFKPRNYPCRWTAILAIAEKRP